jgi:hypothetical protein
MILNYDDTPIPLEEVDEPVVLLELEQEAPPPKRDVLDVATFSPSRSVSLATSAWGGPREASGRPDGCLTTILVIVAVLGGFSMLGGNGIGAICFVVAVAALAILSRHDKVETHPQSAAVVELANWRLAIMACGLLMFLLVFAYIFVY